MRRLLTLTTLLLLIALTACEEQATAPDPQPDEHETQLARGGIPGPPSGIIIPAKGPPPRVPVPLPPGAGPPSFLSDVVAVGAGAHFSCGLRSDGAAFCWGENGDGQLGDGTQTAIAEPVAVRGHHVFDQLVVGDRTACGVTMGGSAYCWGDNSAGQLGAGLPIEPSSFSPVPVPVSGGLSFTTLDVGLRTACGVATDGATYCWGLNTWGQLGNGAVGGPSNVPVPVLTSADLGFVSVNTGYFNTCALTGSGAVYCWGNDGGLYGNGTTGSGSPIPVPAAGGMSLSSVGVGSLYACGLDTGSEALCWGSSNLVGQLGLGSFVAPVLSPTPVVGDLSFALLDTHDNNSILAHTCALTATNQAFCWGSNRHGQLGGTGGETCSYASFGDFDCASTPVAVETDIPFTSLAVGIQHTCAVAADGAAYCWGDNQYGQLGDGTTDNSQLPVRVRALRTSGKGPIEVTPLRPTLTLLGSTQQFTAVALDDNGDPLSPQPHFTWSSSEPTVATVDQTGLATALTTGTTVIDVTAPSGASGRATLDVNIIDPVLAFQKAYVGNGGLASDGVVVLGGLLADEWGHSGTFQTRLQVDRRTIADDNVTVAQAFGALRTARVALEFEATRLESVSPGNPEIGRMLTLAGFTYLALAENWCSGLPLDDPDIGLTTDDVLGLAVTRFTEALAGPIDAALTDAARVGRARALTDLGDLPAAATGVASVPTGFVLNTTHSSTQGLQNGVYLLNTQIERVTLEDAEGGNGLPFRSASDPRVPWTRTEGGTDVGFNGFTPQYDLLKYPAAASPLPLASGTEARLIEAEALLDAGDATGFLGVVNSLRSSIGLAAVPDPGTADGRLDLLFEERAYWLVATGHRLGDLRRLIALYGRTATTEFPTGPHSLGGSYGAEVNLPVPTSARGPNFTGCTDRGR